MAKKLKKILRMLFSAIAVWIALELMVSALLLLIDKPKFSYASNYRSLLESNSPDKDKWFGIHLSHPYFGFVVEKFDGKVNNMGFFDKNDFPYVRKKNQFVVGIFGSSIAKVFATNQTAKEIVAGALKKRYRKLADKEIIFLNFANATAKQPQSFYIFSYFQNTIDLAINIDGYSEVAITPGPEYPVDYPLDSKYYFRNNARDMAMLGRLEMARTFTRGIARFALNIPFLQYSQIYHLFTNKIYAQTEQWAFRLTADLRRTAKPVPSEPITDTIGKRVEVWERFTEMESRLGRELGINTLFFVHPNQYVSGTKSLSNEERQNYFSGPLEIVDLGLRGIEQAALKLSQRGVHVNSLLGIFKNHPETLYEDDCCHFNPEGNILLAQAIASAISKEQELLIRK